MNLTRLSPLGLCVLAACASPGKSGSSGYQGHGGSSVSAATLAKYAPPALPPEMSRKMQRMLDIRAPGMGILSADGKKLFFTWSVTGVGQVWRLDGPRSFPVQMTGGEDATRIIDATPDGRWIIVSRDRNGEENPGIYLQSTRGGELQPIQHLPGIQTSLQYVTRDSRSVYFRSNDIKPDSYAIYRYELATRKKELIYAGEGNWYLDDVDEKRGTLLLGKSVSNVASEHFELDLKTKQLKPVIGQGEVEDYSVSYAAQPGEFLVLTPKLGDFKRLYRLSRGKLVPVTPDVPHDISSFSLDQPRRRLTYTVNELGYERAHALDALTFKPIRIPAYPNAEQVGFGSSTPNGRWITMSIETAFAPRTSYVYDWETGRSVQWVIPSVPEVDLSGAVRATLEYYPSRDGQKIPMFVRRPKACAEGGCPVIAHFHGGPEGQSTPGLDIFAQTLVDAGFIYVEPNVRGSDGYGKKWIHLDDGAKRLQVVTDIEDFAVYAKKAWAKDGKAPKVGIMGWSYGGYSTLIAMTKFAGAYDAGVAMVGMSNLITFLENTAPYRRKLRTPEYGDPEKDRAALIALSPVTYIDRMKNPLLITQGANDPRVPVGEAVQMQEALQKKGIPSQLIVFGDEGHGASKRANRVLELGHLMSFFEKHLK